MATDMFRSIRLTDVAQPAPGEFAFGAEDALAHELRFSDYDICHFLLPFLFFSRSLPHPRPSPPPRRRQHNNNNDDDDDEADDAEASRPGRVAAVVERAIDGKSDLCRLEQFPMDAQFQQREPLSVFFCSLRDRWAQCSVSRPGRRASPPSLFALSLTPLSRPRLPMPACYWQ